VSKQRDLPISAPGPTKASPRDLEPLKQILLEHGVKFKGAVRGRCVGTGDREAILAAAEKATNMMPRNEALTKAHTAYWSLFDERKK